MSAEFILLLTITIVVLGGFFAYLLYVYNKMTRLKKEVQDLRALEKEF